jgi:hypothetical protein
LARSARAVDATDGLIRMRPTRAEWALLAVALALRLWLVSQATWLPVSDTADYHQLARSLANGDGYIQAYEGSRPEYRGLTFRAFRMPGYPALLAGLYSVFGWNPMVGYAANVACELGTQLLVLALGRQLLTPGASLAAQALFATHVAWSANLMTESVFTFLFTALIVMVVRGLPAASPGGAAGFGLLLAGALFVRPIAVSALPVALAQIVGARPARRAVVFAALILAPAALGLTAWAVRNHQQLGRVVILTTNLGPHNAPSFGLDRSRIVWESRRKSLDEAGINAALLSEIRRVVTGSPVWTAGLYVRRAVTLLSLGRPWEIRTLLARRTFVSDDGSRAAHYAYNALLFQYYVTYPFALGGAILLARERRPLRGLWAVLGAYALTHALVSDGNFRLAAPLYQIVCLFAGHAIAWLGVRRGWWPGEPAPAVRHLGGAARVA